MGTTSERSGVRLEDYNHLKYTIGINRVGQEVLSHVFSWGFVGGSATIKDALFSLPQYSQAKFRKDFKALQREKINNGLPVCQFDITLTYKLLQLLCGLREANDSLWVTETSDSLEYCLYVIKSKRNEVAHESLRLSPTKMNCKLEDLRIIFFNAIQKAGQRFSVDDSKVRTLLTSVTQQLDAIRDSPVPLTTVAEYQKELQASRKACVTEEGVSELTRMLDSVCQVSVAPWLIAGRTVNVSEVFIHPKLKRDEMQIMQRQLSESESYVTICDVLHTTDCDGTQPDFILFSAFNGMGKSTLLKFIIDREVSDTFARGNSERFDLILFLECRGAVFSSLNELAALLLPRTAVKFQLSEFKQTLLSLNLLIAVDDLSELDEKSFSVIKEFLTVMTPQTKVVATASRDRAKDLQREVSALHKRVMFLEVEGIPEDQTLPFLQRTLNHISPNITADRGERGIAKLINSKRLCLQEHLRSPEVLSLIALSWALAPEGLNTSTTVTEIFMLVEDLLVHKVLQHLLRSSASGISTKNALRAKLRKYLFSLSSVAAECTTAGKFTIDPEHLTKLAKDCKDLELPEDYMISAFLNYTEERGVNLSAMPGKVSFSRRSTTVYYAAWHTSQMMRDAPASCTLRQCLGLPSALTGDQVSVLQSVMKHLVGILAVLLPSQLRSRAMEVVDFLRDLGVKKATQWLQYVEESKKEATITQHILQEMGDEWEVEDFAISSTFVDLIRETRPDQLTLTVLENPLNYPHLREVLKVCAQSRDMRLSLHLYKHFWSEKKEVSDKFLDTVMSGPSPCKLESFGGRLSPEAITKLPSSLKKLALHVTPDMLRPLNASLPLLATLRMLYLNLDASVHTDPKTIPSLDVCGRSIVLSLDIWKVNESTVEWSCDVAKALCSNYTRLVLRRSDLDANCCEKWLAALQKRRVLASWVVVGSTCEVVEDNAHLQQCAAKIGCTKFVLMKV